MKINFFKHVNSKDITKEIEGLDIDNNLKRAIALLYILDNMKRTKNKCMYNLCKTVDSAVKLYYHEPKYFTKQEY